MPDEATSDVTSLTVQLLSAYLANNTVPSAELPDLIARTRTALLAPTQPDAAPVYEPAVSVRKSLASPDHIISMIDGKAYTMLTRHLAKNGLKPAEYRERYNLPADYPMVAPAYSEKRRTLARAIGLGRKATGAAAGPLVEPSIQSVEAEAPSAAVKPVAKTKSGKASAAKPVGKAKAAKQPAAKTAVKVKAKTSKDAASDGAVKDVEATARKTKRAAPAKATKVSSAAEGNSTSQADTAPVALEPQAASKAITASKPAPKPAAKPAAKLKAKPVADGQEPASPPEAAAKPKRTKRMARKPEAAVAEVIGVVPNEA